MNGTTNGQTPPYDLQRTSGGSSGVGPLKNKPSIDESLDYSSAVDSESYYQSGSGGGGTGSSVTGLGGAHVGYNQDATDTVHEMHLALLYLLSNPEEFKRAVHTHPPRGATTLAEWNAEYEEDEEDESVITSATSGTPLPFVVFADDAEVVLPQAHTASQLFGIERLEGIELEAAAGIPALSQLFLRWLALMPGGDHLNIIDPPGLTVMRIAGGRYRVTAAHRVVWTWMNEFASLSDAGDPLDNGGDDNHFSHHGGSSSTTSSLSHHSPPTLQVDDLVTMTIVDVFETDNQGKLLSYCPTFDNRAVYKTSHATETIRKSSGKLMSILGRAQQAVAKSEVNKKAAAQFGRMGIMKHARNVADTVRHKVDGVVHQYNSPSRRTPTNRKGEGVTDSKGFEEKITQAAASATAEPQKSPQQQQSVGGGGGGRGEDYISDDEGGEGGQGEEI